MNRRAPCVLCAVALGAFAALSSAQAKSHDPLAHPRAKAKAENQRVLCLLNGGDDALAGALGEALTAYNVLGKLLTYEYQLAPLPAASLPGRALRERLGLGELSLPALLVLDTDDRVLGTLTPDGMVDEGTFDPDRVRGFLQEHTCSPLHARGVLAAGLAEAKETQRHAFVYLSAPW